MYCSQCGNEVKDGEEFCSNCGKSIKSDIETDKANQTNNNNERGNKKVYERK